MRAIRLFFLGSARHQRPAKPYNQMIFPHPASTSSFCGQLERLEKRYHFAATACPQLFNMTEADADAYLEQHGIAADLPAYNDHGAPEGNSRASKNRMRRKKSVSFCFSAASEVDVESQPE